MTTEPAPLDLAHESLVQRADAWDRIVMLLDRLTPDWQGTRATGIESAEHAIEGLASSLAAPPSDPRWMPIDSAPKDGGPFVVARFVDGEEAEPDLDYELGRYSPLMVKRYEPVSDGLFREVEVEACEWAGFNNFGRMTHWMPLPAPPASVCGIVAAATTSPTPTALRDALRNAVVECPHEIDSEKVVLMFDSRQTGHNALAQLVDRLVAAASPSPALDKGKQ